MSIKAKLTVILILIGLTLAAVAGVMLRSYVKTTQQVEIAGAAIDNLHALVKIRSRAARQIKEVVDYVASGAEEEIREFERFGLEANQALEEWFQSIRVKKELEDREEMDEETEAKQLEAKYNSALAMASETFNLLKSEGRGGDYKRAEKNLELFVENELFTALDDVIIRETAKFNDAYDRVLTKSGSLPWIASEVRNQVKIARASTRYSLTVDSVRLSIMRQMKEALDYLIYLERRDRTEYDRFGLDVERALDEWVIGIETQMKLGVQVGRDVEKIKNVGEKYRESLSIVNEVFSLADAGRSAEAFDIIEEKIEPLIDDVLFPDITSIVEESKSRVVGVHKTLLGFTRKAGAMGLGVLAMVALIIFSVSLGLIRQMLDSLNRLKRGTEVIAMGSFDHRIELKSNDELGALASSFNKMAEALQKSSDEIVGAKKYADRIIRSINDSLVVVSIYGRIQTINEVTCKLLGYDKDELIGESIEKILPSQSSGEGIFTKSFIHSAERVYLTKSGTEIPVLFSSSVMREGDKIQGIVCVAKDIRERKQAEDAQKKELLLREIHHRIKNNLQVVSTLLELQSKHIRDEAVAAMFKESQNRVRSMAFIHEKLYMSSDNETIDFADYARDLLSYLFRSYGADCDALRADVSISNSNLKMDKAIACGLIINELVSNSLKHAFPKGRKGSITVEFSAASGDLCTLIVRDDGVGLPDGFDVKDSSSLGLKLVRTLALNQLKGSIDVNRNNGTEFKIIFREK
ncbi:MAG: sensor histidine kinase [Deltaproteobacteria bacterium]